MRIAVIDSGVDIGHRCLSKMQISGMSMILQNEKIVAGTDYTDRVGHGTAVSGIIASHVSDAELFIIKVVEEDVSTDEEVLISALNYIEQNVPCDLINISMGIGVMEHKQEFYEVCRRFFNKRIPIVSAFDNMGSIAYPAAFDCVIGVTSSTHILKNHEIEILESDVVNVCAKGSAQRVAWVNPSYYVGGGDSMACAHVTGIIAATMQKKNLSAMDAVRELGIVYRTAAKIENKPIHQCKEYRKVGIFPFNKEMHSLVRFRDLLPFEIIDIYDIRTSGHVGSDAYKLIGMEKDNVLPIKNIDTISYDEIDALIVGHTDVISEIDKRFDVTEYIGNALKKGLKVYCLDDLEEACRKKKFPMEGFFCPKIRISQNDLLPMGKLYRNGIPIIGVFGTSSKQGKWTLQLELRKRFQKDDYKVGQLGTEPTAYLFGMDECYHFGYHASTEYTEYERISFINSSIHRMEEEGAEVIIGGSQSFTIIYDFGNLVQYPLQQYAFLLGLQPDLVVLNINNTDEIEYIENTVQFIEAAANCKVVACVLFPMDMDSFFLGFSEKKNTISKEIEEEKRKLIAERLGINLYRLDNQEQLDELYNDILDCL